MTKHTPTLILLHGGFQINDNCIETEHAAFIVRACNAHKELVEALNLAQDAMNYALEKCVDQNDAKDIRYALNIAYAALAKAKGE